MEKKSDSQKIFESNQATLRDLQLAIEQAVRNFDNHTDTVEKDSYTVVSIWNLLSDDDKIATKKIVDHFMDLELPESIRSVDTKETFDKIKKTSLF